MIHLPALALLDINIEILFLNAMVLALIATIYAAFSNVTFKNNLLTNLSLGFLFSIISVVILTIPFELISGYLFDTRTVLLSLSGLFFGFLPTIIIVVVSIGYRIYLSGSGLYLGIILIISSSAYGLLWRYFIIHKIRLKKIYALMLFSFISGVIPLLILFLADYSLFKPFIVFILVFYLAVLPVLTFILAAILHNQKQQSNLANVIKEQKTLLQASIDSPKIMEIFVLDKDYKYLVFNSYHRYCMELFYGVSIKTGDSFLTHIENTQMHNRFQSQIARALQGFDYTSIDEVETTKGKYYESMFTPIRDSDNVVIGVGIFSYDITKRKQYEIKLEYLNYYDALTDVYNRRYYNETLIEYVAEEYFPLALLLADVDSLKTINDAFGHSAGDKILIDIASTLKDIVGDRGFVSRIGGDEFVIIFKNTSELMAENYIEEIHHRINQIVVSGIHLSMSIGFDVIDATNTVDEAFKNAEDEMYKNKLFEQSIDKNQTINTIMKSLYEKNSREEMHSQRVARYCELIGEALNLSKDKVNTLRIAGMLHDIGKIAIDDAILDKPGKLTDSEYSRIKKHPEIGYRILSASSQYLDISNDILHHHEHFDGKGYPRGLKGENIPFNSRIISIADSYDAMTLSRPYRSSFTKEEALKEIEKCSGTQFDPVIAGIFINLMKNQ